MIDPSKIVWRGSQGRYSPTGSEGDEIIIAYIVHHYSRQQHELTCVIRNMGVVGQLDCHEQFYKTVEEARQAFDRSLKVKIRQLKIKGILESL